MAATKTGKEPLNWVVYQDDLPLRVFPTESQALGYKAEREKVGGDLPKFTVKPQYE